MPEQSGRRERVTLKIPAELYDNLKELIDGTGFRSVNEFVVHCMRDVASGGKLDRPAPGLSDAEVEAVRQRLRALGYIK
ncbi:MAG: ribbon-helix-helix domain-containing protein [Planctomycetes bacterium]|nr:ribbon-helix-helix domain-containing protein [Planctomycetota bacterium]